MLDVAGFCAFLSIGDPVGIGLERVASSLSVRVTPKPQKKTTWLTVPTSVVKTPIGWPRCRTWIGMPSASYGASQAPSRGARESDSARTVVQRAMRSGCLRPTFRRHVRRFGISSPGRKIASAGRESTAWSKTRPTVAAAPARKTTACTARTRSSRTFSPGAHSIT